MTIETGGSVHSSLIERAKNILFTPRTEWDVIADEPATPAGLYTKYAMILAAIPAVMGLLAALATVSFLSAFAGRFGVGVALGPFWAVMEAVKSYALSLVMVYVMALIIDGLAPNFGGQRSLIQALKVSTYAATAFWVAGLAMIIPPLGILAMCAAAVYTCFLIYLGLKQVMQAPDNQAVAYTAVTIVISLVVALIINAIVSIPFGLSKAVTGGIFGMSRPGFNLNLGDGTKINVREIEKAAKEVEEATKRMEVSSVDGTVTITTGASSSTEALQALLPGSLPGGFARTELSGGGMQGVAVEAKGVYQRGSSKVDLSIVDSGALGAVNAFAGGITQNRTTADGYEKMGQVNGRLTIEEYNRPSNHGKYAVMVGNRFMVAAEGDGVSVNDLKAAVDAVPFNRLEAMAKS